MDKWEKLRRFEKIAILKKKLSNKENNSDIEMSDIQDIQDIKKWNVWRNDFNDNTENNKTHEPVEHLVEASNHINIKISAPRLAVTSKPKEPPSSTSDKGVLPETAANTNRKLPSMPASQEKRSETTRGGDA